MILIESMGQCGGAGIKKLVIGGDALYGFVVMENVKFFSNVEFGQTVKMVIKNLKISNKVIKQYGTAFVMVKWLQKQPGCVQGFHSKLLSI